MRAIKAPPAKPRAKRHVYLLDVLMEIRREAQSGRPMWLFFGSEHFDAMAAYLTGYVFCCYRNGFQDREWGDFVEWLREVRKQMPEGWARKYVEDSGGDHMKAMMKFLDYVAEFRALRAKRGTSSARNTSRKGGAGKSTKRLKARG